MSKRRRRHATPSYPRLTVLAALGLGLAAAGCGPDLRDQTTTLPDNQQLVAAQPADAGPGPTDSDYFAGGMPAEFLPDGGVP
jgi:hypothetical protein